MMSIRENARDLLLAAGASLAGIAIGAGIAFLLVGPAWGHPVTNTRGEQLGINYPPGCCNSAATNPNGDCAPIDDRYVREGPDGYEINLPIGAHPKLKTKGYSGVVPYSAARQPLSNDYHICLAENGTSRLCFFGKPGAV